MSIQRFTEPCHLPCPDLPHHSLTKEDKERGLVWLEKVRAELEAKRATVETERERRKRVWRTKLKEKSLRLPNRALTLS